VATDPVDFEEMATEENHCAETQRLLCGTSLKLAFRQTGAQRLADDVSTGVFRQIVPLKYRKDIFAHFHNVAHPWEAWLLLYIFIQVCAARIIQPHHRLDPQVPGLPVWQDPPPHTPGPQPIPIPQRCFPHLHVDLVGPLQYINSFNYIFIITDRTSKWMEAIPLAWTSAAACAKALTFTWISRFGVPETITSDRRPQFTSNLWLQLCEMLNILKGG
jgi:hypothetical protein